MKGFINGVFSYSSSNYLHHRKNASKRLTKSTHQLRWVFPRDFKKIGLRNT